MAGSNWSQADPVGEVGTYAEPAPGFVGGRAASEQEMDPVAELLEELQRDLPRWDFFAAVRRLECVASHLPRVGHSTLPSEDLVRFGQVASLIFAPTDLVGLKPARIELRTDGTAVPMRFMMNFFGLLGPNGPLPQWITDYIRHRTLQRDHTLTEFLDIFHHRMASLYYRAWSSSNQAVQFERGKQDRYAVYLGSLFGRSDARFEEEGQPKLHYAGRLIGQTRNVEGLESILSDFFEVPVDIEEFVGQWQEIPVEFRCQMKLGARSTCLGQPAVEDEDASTAIVGSRVWDCQQKVRIRVGPMSAAEMERLLPPGESMGRLIKWVEFYAGPELVWDLNLIVAKDDVPATVLGGSGRLGWNTWIRSLETEKGQTKPTPRPLKADADQLVLSPSQARWRAAYESHFEPKAGVDVIQQLALQEGVNYG